MVTEPPTTMASDPGPCRLTTWRIRSAVRRAASAHGTGSRPASPRPNGAAMRSATGSKRAKRPRSQSQPSSTSGWLRDRTRSTLPSRSVAHVLQPVGHCPQTVGTLTISHGRALKRYGVGSSAPTGHSSVTLPEKRPV